MGGALTETIETTSAGAAGASGPGPAAVPASELQALPRRERVRALMRAEILEAARKLFQEDGI